MSTTRPARVVAMRLLYWATVDMRAFMYDGKKDEVGLLVDFVHRIPSLIGDDGELDWDRVLSGMKLRAIDLGMLKWFEDRSQR